MATFLPAQQATMVAAEQAYGDTFLFATIVMAIGIPAALFLPKVRGSRA